jgi:hypothetical protein
MVTLPGGHTHFIDEIRLWNIPVTVESNEGTNAYGNSVGSKSQGLCGIGTVADATGGNQADLSVQP